MNPSRPRPAPHRPAGLLLPARSDPGLRVRLARPEDIPGLITLSRTVYGPVGAWLTREMRRHQEIFPEGQLVVEELPGGSLLGMAVSLVIDSAAWPFDAPWAAVTDRGRLSTHDLESGDTLYGAGLAVHPAARGRGVARQLYAAREAMLARLGLDRIRAGARIPGYGRVAEALDPELYVNQVRSGERRDPTLSFQLHMGFRILGVARDYLPQDRESRGHAAVVEWTAGTAEG